MNIAIEGFGGVTGQPSNLAIDGFGGIGFVAIVRREVVRLVSYVIKFVRLISHA
jgi:hypothetical protein